jgi:hypothetical protein
MIHVSRTLAEIRATATKAARGAGHDWGLAEEAGVATRVLESHDLPGVHVLARLLSGAGGAAQCGLRAMAALSDRLPFPDDAIPEGPGGGTPVAGRALDPFRAGTGHVPYAPLGRGDHPLCTPTGVVAQGSLDADIAARVVLEPSPGGPDAPRGPDWKSRILAAADWDVLERFAAKTLVPDTAASRALGAGPADTSVD